MGEEHTPKRDKKPAGRHFPENHGGKGNRGGKGTKEDRKNFKDNYGQIDWGSNTKDFVKSEN